MPNAFPTPRQRAITALNHVDDLTGLGKPECVILGYERGWAAAIDFTISIVEELSRRDNEETDDEQAE